MNYHGLDGFEEGSARVSRNRLLKDKLLKSPMPGAWCTMERAISLQDFRGADTNTQIPQQQA